MAQEGALYRRIFRDICKGYSLSNINEQKCFIKHLTTNDQVDLEDIYEDYFSQAKKKGVPSEEEMLELLINQGQWSKEEDDFVASQKTFIETLNNNKKHIVLLSRREAHDKLIEQEKAKLDEKLILKESLLGSTCEKYAGQRVSDYYIIKSHFKDEALSIPFFSVNEFDEFSNKDIRSIVSNYNDIFEKFSEENIRDLTLSPFYEVYFAFCENSLHFFGKAVCELSSNQIKLMTYTRVFKNILEGDPNIPEHIKKDAAALLDWASTSEKEKESLKNQLDKDGATTVIGATAEDYKHLGVDAQLETKAVSLHDEAEKKGGSLTMEDLMKLTGE